MHRSWSSPGRRRGCQACSPPTAEEREDRTRATGHLGNTVRESHLSLLIKAQDVVAHATGPAALDFMFVSEELLASEASPVVQLAVRENPQQSALPRIHVAHHSHPGDQTGGQ